MRFNSDWRPYFRTFSINFPRIVSFPLTLWFKVEIPKISEFSRFWWQNEWIPLIFWFLFANHEIQQILSGNATISASLFSKSCVMTHRFVRLLAFSRFKLIWPENEQFKVEGENEGENWRISWSCGLKSQFFHSASVFGTCSQLIINKLWTNYKLRKKGENSPGRNFPLGSPPIFRWVSHGKGLRFTHLCARFSQQRALKSPKSLWHLCSPKVGIV